jgi:hypothetical protein
MVFGMFEKLWKATPSFIMSAHPSVHMKQFGSNWMKCHELWYLSIFRECVKKVQVSLKSDNTDGCFTRRCINIMISFSIIFRIRIRIRNVSEKHCWKIKINWGCLLLPTGWNYTYYGNLERMITHIVWNTGQGNVFSTGTIYGLGSSGDRILMGAKCSALVQTSCGNHPASCTMDIRSVSQRYSGQIMAIITHPIYCRG